MSQADPVDPSALAAVLDGLVTDIDHVGVAVPDLDAAVRLWSALGLHVEHEEVNVEQDVREAMLRGPGGSPTRLQLIAPTSPGSAIARFLGTRGPGLQQLALTVTDVEEAIRRLTAAGLRVLYDTPRRGTAGSRITFVHPKDTGGVLLELVEPAGSSAPSPQEP